MYALVVRTKNASKTSQFHRFAAFTSRRGMTGPIKLQSTGHISRWA